MIVYLKYTPLYNTYYCLTQETKEAMPIEDVNDIWNRTKDLGILLGKGGLYGSVSTKDIYLNIFNT